MLQISGLVCRPEGEAPVLGVDLEIKDGEFVGLVGPNGSGKATLCRCLGLSLRPDAGRIHFDGRLLAGEPWEAARAGLIVLQKGRRVFPELTVFENLLVAPSAWCGGDQSVRLAAVYQLFPRLKERRSQRAGTLSGGEQQMVAIGRALMSSPRLLVLDEPALGLSPRATVELYAALGSIRGAGCSVLVTDEDFEHVRRLAARIYVIRNGRILARGHPDEVVGIVASG